MKIWISFDFEGVAGIVDWAQCLRDGARYEQGCELVLGEVNAAIEGAAAAGATEFVVNDSHGRMFNLDPRKLAGNASYLSGAHKPLYMMEGLDDSFAAAFWVGYHGMISGIPATLSHSYNPDVFTGSRVNGVEVGEGGINALVAEHHGVPVALIAGDNACAEQNAGFAPGGEVVVVKESITRFAGLSLHPDEARARIRAAAGRAIASVREGRAGLPGITRPVELDLDLATADLADIALWVKGVERVGLRTVRCAGDDLLAVFRSYVAVNYITRQVGGR